MSVNAVQRGKEKDERLGRDEKPDKNPLGPSAEKAIDAGGGESVERGRLLEVEVEEGWEDEAGEEGRYPARFETGLNGMTMSFSPPSQLNIPVPPPLPPCTPCPPRPPADDTADPDETAPVEGGRPNVEKSLRPDAPPEPAVAAA